MIGVSHRSGPLVVIRVRSPVTMDELDAFAINTRKVVASIRGPVVFCSDLRGAQLMSDALVEKIMASMRRENPRVERSALLLPTKSAVLALQFERIIREVGNPRRRSFRDVSAAIDWLSEVLSPDEQKSLRAFVAEHTEE